MAQLSAQGFIGWGRLQDVMFEPFGTDAQTVTGELINQGEDRFSALSDEAEKARAVTAYVWYYAWQGLADQRDLTPAQDRQGDKSETFNESQLALYRSKAAAAREQLQRFMPELKGEQLEFGGPLYGGADTPAAFTFGPYENRRGLGQRPEHAD